MLQWKVYGICLSRQPFEKDDEHEEHEEISSDGPDDGLTDVETTSQAEALKPAMPLNGSCPEQMLQSSQHKFSVVIKNSNETTENCVKCKKKLISVEKAFTGGVGECQKTN